MLAGMSDLQHVSDDIGGYQYAARITGIQVSTLYSLVCQRRIPHIRLSRRMVRFRRSDLEGWLQARSVEPSSGATP